MPDIFVGENTEKKEDHAGALPENVIKNPQSHRHINRPNFLSAYREHPASIILTESLVDEDLLLFLRSHFVTNVPWIIKALLLALAPFAIFIASTFIGLSINFLPDGYITLILIFYYFFILSGYVFVKFLTWFYNISIVTNIRIIDIDFSSLVFENVDATKLTQVEDVGYEQIGIVRSIFDYGNVHVQTAGTAQNIEFLAVPHPERVVKIIHDLMGEAHNA